MSTPALRDVCCKIGERLDRALSGHRSRRSMWEPQLLRPVVDGPDRTLAKGAQCCCVACQTGRLAQVQTTWIVDGCLCGTDLPFVAAPHFQVYRITRLATSIAIRFISSPPSPKPANSVNRGKPCAFAQTNIDLFTLRSGQHFVEEDDVGRQFYTPVNFERRLCRAARRCARRLIL